MDMIAQNKKQRDNRVTIAYNMQAYNVSVLNNKGISSNLSHIDT